jgi:hypothetical protein
MAEVDPQEIVSTEANDPLNVDVDNLPEDVSLYDIINAKRSPKQDQQNNKRS